MHFGDEREEFSFVISLSKLGALSSSIIPLRFLLLNARRASDDENDGEPSSLSLNWPAFLNAIPF